MSEPFSLEDFVRESNRIEGIERDPSKKEIVAHSEFLRHDGITITDLQRFVDLVQPGALLRAGAGMDVSVGQHIPPLGGPQIVDELNAILSDIYKRAPSPYGIHTRYETLHPFMDGNGRSGRILWLWMMGGMERVPLGFLHTFYYQTLGASGR